MLRVSTILIRRFGERNWGLSKVVSISTAISKSISIRLVPTELDIMPRVQFQMKATLFILACLCFNVESFDRHVRRLSLSVHGKQTESRPNNRAASTHRKHTASFLNNKAASSIISVSRPGPQMIPVPFDYLEDQEHDTDSAGDEYDGLFDGVGQSYGLSENSIVPSGPVMSFEREFDARSTSLLELVFESPSDSPAAVRSKNVLRSVTLLVLLLGTTFTASYYVFPGSFQHYTVIGQFHPRYTTSLPSLSSFEQAEYSESGGVVWGEIDDFLPKTTVTINDGLVISDQEPYEVRLQPLEDL